MRLRPSNPRCEYLRSTELLEKAVLSDHHFAVGIWGLPLPLAPVSPLRPLGIYQFFDILHFHFDFSNLCFNVFLELLQRMDAPYQLPYCSAQVIRLRNRIMSLRSPVIRLLGPCKTNAFVGLALFAPAAGAEPGLECCSFRLACVPANVIVGVPGDAAVGSLTACARAHGHCLLPRNRCSNSK